MFPERALERLQDLFIDPFVHTSSNLFRAPLPRVLRRHLRRRRALGHLDSFDRKLEHALGLVDVLEAPLPDRAYHDALRQRRPEKRSRRLGEKHVAARSGRRQPRSANHVDAVVPLLADGRLSRMET